MIEPEMAFADLNDDMDNAEAMLKYVLTTVMEKCPDELAMLQQASWTRACSTACTTLLRATSPASPTPRP